MQESKQSRGGRVRAERLSAHDRSTIASRAANARWGVPKATHQGALHIGNLTIDCAVLPDGRRVLSQRSLGRALGRGYGGNDWRIQQKAVEGGGGKLPFFLAAKSLIPFISNDLMPLVNSPIQYRHSQGGGVAHGLEASVLPMICDVWLKARDAKALTRAQEAVAVRADMLMRGLAHVGIIALVDEATGYQDVRDRQALQAILDKFLAKELAAWAKRFPDEFYKEIFRLRRWHWNALRRPGVVAAWTNDLVYARLAPGVLEELQARNPMLPNGRRASKHHQWLSSDIGHPALAQHLHAVIGLMRASNSWDEFKTLINRAFPKRGRNLELDL
ncbi:MAG TPA: P63C domain-containing protein [Rhodanobacteraceae bacterium]